MKSRTTQGNRVARPLFINEKQGDYKLFIPHMQLQPLSIQPTQIDHTRHVVLKNMQYFKKSNKKRFVVDRRRDVFAYGVAGNNHQYGNTIPIGCCYATTEKEKK